MLQLIIRVGELFQLHVTHFNDDKFSSSWMIFSSSRSLIKNNLISCLDESRTWSMNERLRWIGSSKTMKNVAHLTFEFRIIDDLLIWNIVCYSLHSEHKSLLEREHLANIRQKVFNQFLLKVTLEKFTLESWLNVNKILK